MAGNVVIPSITGFHEKDLDTAPPAGMVPAALHARLRPQWRDLQQWRIIGVAVHGESPSVSISSASTAAIAVWVSASRLTNAASRLPDSSVAKRSISAPRRRTRTLRS